LLSVLLELNGALFGYDDNLNVMSALLTDPSYFARTAAAKVATS
jgi:hypothetical protein